MRLFTTLLIILFFGICFGQDDQVASKRYQTDRVTASKMNIDGQLSEAAWSQVEWGGGDFRVRRPNEGDTPTHQTRFKILHDDKNLYIGIRCFDDEPDKIVKRMSRRDGFEGDWVEVNIDSYFDKQTAFSFTITAAGVKGDEFISSNGNNWDSGWDPIWFVETSIDDKGWIAEMKIPLSQLRFGEKEKQVWGVQVNRRIFRKDERSNWIFIPQNSNGWVHHFGELHGLTGLKAQRQIELLPYSVAKRSTSAVEDGNPFATGSDSDFTLGLDGKVGITSDLTMDFTVNPDFGQVEADPSELNLTAFETFFSERRPFFTEGRNILAFQVTPAAWGDYYSSDNLFYSRRIGKRPGYSPDLNDGEFADRPVNTSILGAAKITGKTRNGWSIGIMESVTAEEKATIDLNGDRRQEVVEPATNYLVGRVRKDINQGNSVVGVMATSVNRRINNDNLNFMHTSAYTGGVDFEHNLNDRKYYVDGKLIFSQVNGDEEAILSTQTASARFFQRPDADHLSIDSSLTSLSGHGGTFRFGKRGNFKYQSGITWRSPGIELNDIGFLTRADEINQWTWVGYRITKPFGIFNNIGINFNNHNSWDTDRNRLSNLLNHNNYVELKNQWRGGFSVTRVFDGVSNNALRGGPRFKQPGRTFYNVWVNSDQRKKIHGGFGGNQRIGDEDSQKRTNYWLWLAAQPTDRLSLSFSPFYNMREADLQYISNIDDRYIFGGIEQETSGFTFRLNFNVTPELTIEYYGSPFVTAGTYVDFKQVDNPGAEEYRDRFKTFAASDVQFDEENDAFDIDENGDGLSDFSVGNPNFNFRDFNSNLVVRWEYSAGSTLFLVWSQNRSDFVSQGKFDFGNDLRDLFNSRGDNVFLIKFNRWFSM